MKRERLINMTQGNPTLLLLLFTVPMLVGNLFQQAYSIADSIIVGRFVGSGALAAVGATGSVTFLFFSICNGISSGCSIVASQAFGAGDVRKTKRVIANASYLMLSMSIVMCVIAYALTPWALRLMGTPEDILPDATVYMRLSCIGVPLVAVYNYASSMLRALGDSRTPLAFLITACFLNIVLDLFCVIVLKLGVMGVALATIIAQMISGVGCLWYAIRFNPYFLLTKEDFLPDRSVITQSVRLGLPLAMQWSMIALSTTALQSFINSYGTVAVAAFTTTSRIDQLMHQPLGSLSTALATYAGQNVGAGRMDRVKKGLHQAMLMSFGLTCAMIVVDTFFSRQLVSVFVSDPAVIDIGAQAVKLTAWFYFALSAINVIRGTLNGVGDALFAFINGAVEIVCRIGLPMMLVFLPPLGMMSIWWVNGACWLISALFCLWRYLSWRKKA